MSLCGLSGGRKLQTTLQTGILIVCCTVMFFCSCCLAFSVSGECGEVLLLFWYHQLLNIVKLAGLIVWFGFTPIIWSICFISMDYFLFWCFFTVLLNISGMFFRRVCFMKGAFKKGDVLLVCCPLISSFVRTYKAQGEETVLQRGFWWGEKKEMFLFCFLG